MVCWSIPGARRPRQQKHPQPLSTSTRPKNRVIQLIFKRASASRPLGRMERGWLWRAREWHCCRPHLALLRPIVKMGYSLVDGLDEWRLRTLGEWASLAVRAYRNGATTFSGPNNIINFFMDDLLSFAPEAGAGFIDRIQMTVPSAESPALSPVLASLAWSWRASAFSAGGDGGRRPPELRTTLALCVTPGQERQLLETSA